MKFKMLEQNIKQLQDYLGPRCNYTTDPWPLKQPDKWLMEYLILLKKDYYRRLKIKRLKNKEEL